MGGGGTATTVTAIDVNGDLMVVAVDSDDPNIVGAATDPRAIIGYDLSTEQYTFISVIENV